MRVSKWVINLMTLVVAGCASTPESVTTEHKGKVVIVHHRRRASSGLVDRIEAINPSGVVTQAEIHVYDVGRLVDASGNVQEAHRMYRIVQSSRPNLMLPKHVSGGPRTVYTSPNYSPPPNDQRINDAVAEAQEAKKKLDDARANIEKRLAEDNNLRGQLQEVEDQNAALNEQLRAAMSAQHSAKPAPQTDAEKAAQSGVDPLVQWGSSLNGQQ